MEESIHTSVHFQCQNRRNYGLPRGLPPLLACGACSYPAACCFFLLLETENQGVQKQYKTFPPAPHAGLFGSVFNIVLPGLFQTQKGHLRAWHGQIERRETLAKTVRRRQGYGYSHK